LIEFRSVSIDILVSALEIEFHTDTQTKYWKCWKTF